MFVKSVQFSLGYSFFFEKHGIHYTLYYFHTTLQWFCLINTVTISWAEQRLSPWERKYFRKLAGNCVFKNLNDFYTSVLNSKNMNTSRNCYEIVQINFQPRSSGAEGASAPPKFSENVPFFSRSSLNVPFLKIFSLK